MFPGDEWDGDTLVIDTVGFNEKQWAVGAFPNTAQLHLTERISRPALKSLTYEFTVDDPGAYTKPWSGKWSITGEDRFKANPRRRDVRVHLRGRRQVTAAGRPKTVIGR